MEISQIKELVALLDASGLSSLVYENGPVRLCLQKGGQPAAPAPVPAQGAAPAAQGAAPAAQGADGDQGVVTVSAPLVGSVYRARQPGQGPLVSVGDAVAKGAPLCIIEAMKMYNDITAPCSGRVAKILFDDGQLAEYGQPLVQITPDD